MKYIMLTHIQTGSMFMSFVVVECLYLIHGNDAKKSDKGGVDALARYLM